MHGGQGDGWLARVIPEVRAFDMAHACMAPVPVRAVARFAQRKPLGAMGGLHRPGTARDGAAGPGARPLRSAPDHPRGAQ